jgi:hypothetical protein
MEEEMTDIQELKYTQKRVMKVGGKGLNLYYTGSYQDLKAGATNNAQTWQSSNSTDICQIICISQSYRNNTNLSMFK